MAIDRTPNRSVWYGSLIMLAVLAFTFAIFFVPDLYRKMVPSIEIVAVMAADAGALEPGAEVWIAGHEVGTITSVDLQPVTADSATRVAVKMDVPKKYLRYIPRDSEVRMTTARLIGKPVLDILPGSAKVPIRDHDTLVVRVSGTLTGLLERTEALTATSARFFTDMEAIEGRTTNRAAEVRRLNRNLETTMAEFRALTATMRSSPIRTISDPAFKRMLQNLTTASRQLSNALGSAADRARRAQNDAEPSLRRLAARADTIQGIVTALQTRIQEGGGGLLIRAQKDSAIVKGLHEAQVQMDSLIAETKRNPLRFWL